MDGKSHDDIPAAALREPDEVARQMTGEAYDIPLDEEKSAGQLLDEFFGQTEHVDAVTCSIYELGGPQRKERSYLFCFPFTDDLSSARLFDDLLDRYGAGWYELQAQRQSDKKWAARKVFRVGSARAERASLVPPKPDTEEKKKSRPDELPPGLEALLKSQQALLERLIEVQSDRRERSSDPITMLKDFAEIKSLFSQPPSPTSEIFSVVRDVLKLKDELGGDGGDSSPFKLAIKELGPVLSKAVEKLSDQQPAATPNGAGSGTTSMLNLNDMFAELHGYATQARASDEVAERVLQRLADGPEWIEAAVIAMIFDERERVVGRIVGSYPPLKEYERWLREVVTHILAMMETAEQSENTTDAAPTTSDREPASASDT